MNDLLDIHDSGKSKKNPSRYEVHSCTPERVTAPTRTEVLRGANLLALSGLMPEAGV